MILVKFTFGKKSSFRTSKLFLFSGIALLTCAGFTLLYSYHSASSDSHTNPPVIPAANAKFTTPPFTPRVSNEFIETPGPLIEEVLARLSSPQSS